MDEKAEAEAALRERNDGEDEEEAEEEDELERAISLSAGGDQAEDAKVCLLFKGMVFFIQRECPRDMMVFIIRSFGARCAGTARAARTTSPTAA